MHRTILKLPLHALAVALATGLVLVADRTVLATAGFAEWEIATPGGHRISHIDPLKERYGTCLRKADDTPGAVLDGPARVFVEQLEWWQYYPDHVLGKARGGLFIFDESTEKVHYFKSEEGLSSEIRLRRLGQPLSPRRTPADGWYEAWMPVIRDRCAQFEKDGPGDSETSESVRAAMREYCDQVPAR
jgi:hypothetical protein